jgi:hypothetical protein
MTGILLKMTGILFSCRPTFQEAHIAFAREQLCPLNPFSSVLTSQLPGRYPELPAETDDVDVVVSGLALNFIPTPITAVTEMVRVTRLGGVVAAYVWDYADRMQMLRYFWDAATEIDSAAKTLDEGHRFPLCRPAALEALFQQAGLTNIEVLAMAVPTNFRDFDDYGSPFLGGQGPAPGYVMSLSDLQRSTLAERLRTMLPVAEDRTIVLSAGAWAIRGQV